MSDALLKGRYLLGTELGRGGFAVAYLATDLELASRKVVVKVLNEQRADDSWSLRKFRSEMEALARIEHPNVVTVTDFGQTPDGKPFLVMQYIAGENLRRLIPRDGMPLARVAYIIRQIGRALSAAHDAGVCHRDLKPENVIVQTGSDTIEQLKLIDFGLAGIRTPDASSQSEVAAGTYAYMAPEQFEGRSGFSTDVYQLGVLAYELVTGIVPFRGSTPGAIVLQQMQGLKLLPKDLRPDLSDAAQQIIRQALSANPQDRYASPREFGDALAAALVSTDLDRVEWTKPEPHTSTSAPITPQSPPSRRTRWLLSGVLIFLIAACFGIYYYIQMNPRSAGSVAVLPFQNETHDPQLGYVAEGVTDSLIDDLSRIPTLRVSAAGSVKKYARTDVDPLTAARTLGVTRVVYGSISKDKDTLLLHAELIDVKSGTRLWGNRAEVASLSQATEQFSSEITDQLRLKLSGTLKERLKRQYAVGSQAYAQYLQGRSSLNKRTAPAFQEAIRYFDQATATDPNYAPAYSGLAQTYGYIAMFGSADGGMLPTTALAQEREAAQRALELDGTLAEAYAALGQVEMQADYKWTDAEQDFRRAIDLNPSWATAHELYAFDLGASGRFADAIREAQEAVRHEPDVDGFKAAQGLVLRMARRNDESLTVLRPIVSNPATKWLVADYVVENYWAKSMPDQALAAVEGLPSSVTPHLRIPLLATAYARAGQQSTARELLQSYAADANTAWWYYLALAHLSLHETDKAVDGLENAYKQRYAEVIWLGVDPLLDELRTYPRFRALLDRVRENAFNVAEVNKDHEAQW